jgi:hypothetical protein
VPQIRTSIKALFPDRDCFTLVRPMHDERQLNHLDTLEAAQLRPEFQEVGGVVGGASEVGAAVVCLHMCPLSPTSSCRCNPATRDAAATCLNTCGCPACRGCQRSRACCWAAPSPSALAARL